MDGIAIILARGGSKRIPRKNIIDFQGKPMIAWTIEAALLSGRFKTVLVSTDDKEIAQISRFFGAEVPFLRDKATDDHATASEACIAALDQAMNHWDTKYSVVTQLMANCPLRDKNDIQQAFDEFQAKQPAAQISGFRFGWMNPWWATKIGKDGKPQSIFPEAKNSRSQDLEPLYCPSGAIWIAQEEELRAAATFYAPGHIFHIMNWMSAMDIDDAEDMAMANACFSLKQKSERGV